MLISLASVLIIPDLRGEECIDKKNHGYDSFTCSCHKSNCTFIEQVRKRLLIHIGRIFISDQETLFEKEEEIINEI